MHNYRYMGEPLYQGMSVMFHVNPNHKLLVFVSVSDYTDSYVSEWVFVN